jgi:hypothetical protein
MIRILLGVIGVAALATGADALWYELGIEHRAITGIVHGAALLAAVGAVVGLATERVVGGVAVGAAAGMGGALAYYATAPLTGGVVAVGVGWAAVWLLLATLDGRLLRAPPRTWPTILGRGTAAALLSGLAFFAVLRTLWGPPPADGRNYLVQFGAWLLAWAPGLLCLTLPVADPGSVAASRDIT